MTVCHSLLVTAKRQPGKFWKVFQAHSQLLTDLGIGDIAEARIHEAEKLICPLYKVSDDVWTDAHG